MMTSILQLLVLVVAAFAFAVYALWIDRREHAAKIKKVAQDDPQGSIYFPEHKPDDEHDRRGAAMSRL
jgi:hypothetical protein